jgi:pSer/pThr/pTyr-binding forkhead associated (FHA) protein
MKPRYCRFGHEVPEGSVFCDKGDDLDESYDPAAKPANQAPEQDSPTPGQDNPTPVQLVLVFPAGEVTVSRNQQAQLGRDPGLPHAQLFTAYDNVSRRHATVGMDEAGRAWIRDDESANGTFVNVSEITPKVPHPLRDGDSVRLAADLTAKSQIIYLS